MPSKAKRSHMTMVVHGPHEAVDELLLLGGRVVHHRYRDRCRVVLVLRQTQLVQPSIGTFKSEKRGRRKRNRQQRDLLANLSASSSESREP